VVVVLAAGVAAGEWLRRPSVPWAVVGVAAVLVALVALGSFGSYRRGALATALAALALSLGVAQWRLTSIERHWPEQRKQRIDAAYGRLGKDLHSAFRRAERLAAAAAGTARTHREDAFEVLDGLIARTGPEESVVVLDSTGQPWAWAGRHRLAPRLEGDSVGSRSTGYYVELEARRHTPEGGVAIAGVLIWAHPAVADRDRSLAQLFRERTEVDLVVYPPGTAPDSAEVFDYEEPTATGQRLLFSVEPVPAEQGSARELAYERAARVITWVVLAMLAFAFTLATGPIERLAIMASVVWLAMRAPIGPALGVQPLFSPGTFFRTVLGPLSSSAGVLALAGALLMTAGIWLWRQRLPRTWYGVAMGSLLLLASPYVISSLGRGITPPAEGVSVGLWLIWQLALLVAAAALIVPAAALFRGAGPDTVSTSWRIVAGVAIACAAAIIGVLVWSPRGGWPDWYTFLWTPALLLVTLPAPRWAAISGIALVAGSSSALVTWGAELAGKVQVAQRDVARLGSEADPLAVPLLERFAEEARKGRPPRTASRMYALWHQSSIGSQGYPAHLALWSNAGAPIDELTLDSLDLPPALLSAMVRSFAPTDTQQITQLLRVPGVHYVLRVRVTPAEVLTVAVGPRSALVVPGRVGRLLDPSGRELPLYRLSLSPPLDPSVPTPQPRWRREGWLLRNEYPIDLPGGPRTVHALVELRGPVPLFVRGILVVLLDAAVLASLWFAAELVAGAQPRRPRWWNLRRSFRMRIAGALAAFFLLPATGFAVWSFVRLSEEVQRSRDLMITETLRDAVLAAGGVFLVGDAELGQQLRELSRRVDADLVLYQGGRLMGASTTVLEDLGVAPQLMDPPAFRALMSGGELEVTRDGSIPKLAERVGYRVVHPGAPADIGVLATPQLAYDPSLAIRQFDLALVLLLATLAGIAAAIAAAQRASRTLSRPVADLQRSALALGRGQPVPSSSGVPLLEFEPVFGAFERMVADIATSREALEQARRRTSAVLATVATGVVGLDPEGRVLIANRRAVELLGAPLDEGDMFAGRLGPEWRSLTDAVGNFLRDPAADATAELEVGGRRLSLHLASLGSDVRGAVIALNDVTDVSRAERVLAWGEMARQVAHEIKNPLTPMRLGLQHLQRVYRDRPGEFDRTLDDTAGRMLGEIDRLDTIARAFSRFAAPAADDQPLDRIDLAATVGEVVQLYRLADGGCEVRLSVVQGAFGAARADEVKEVVVNLLENARNAGAGVVEVAVGPGRISVSDDGAGISAEMLPRIFEPRFSTTTSGAGLGLAIVRRLVEGWGGSIEVSSEVGRGTRITLQLAG
jgi:signal transduction histidine kinase